MPMYSTRHTCHSHSGWAVFGWIMAGLLVLGIILKYWWLILLVGAVVALYRTVSRRRAAAELERQRLLHNAYQPQSDGWLTPEQWAARHRG